MSSEPPIPEEAPVGGPAPEPTPAALSPEPNLEPEPSPLEAHESHTHDDAFQCPNCGAENRGEFCARCGQKRLHDEDLTFKHAWHHVAHETLHVDGKLLGTLNQLLARPGQLTLDFIEGRRARHVHPVRLFLLLSAVFFVFGTAPSIIQLIVHDFVSAKKAQSAGPAAAAPASVGVDARLRQRAAREGQSYDLYREHFEQRLLQAFKLAYIFAVAVDGLWYEHYFRRRFRYLAEHMVFALHVACFEMVLFTASGRLSWLLHGASWPPLVFLPMAWAYRMLATRRVYEETWPAIARKTLGIVVLRDVTLWFPLVLLGIFEALRP